MLISSKAISYSKLFNKLCVKTQAFRNINFIVNDLCLFQSNFVFISFFAGTYFLVTYTFNALGFNLRLFPFDLKFLIASSEVSWVMSV